jgi:hypothetical protein
MPIRSKQTEEFEPKLFSVYPEAKMAVNLYFSKNLETVNVDEFRSFLLDVASPKIILDANSNTLAEPLEIGELLTSINIKTLGLAIAYKYLRYLGYRFDQTKKSYYNDGHEKQEQVAYRRRFIVEYFESELSCYVWVQITEETAIKLETEGEKKLLKDIGYTYTADNGVNMREYHVDCHDSFPEFIRENNKQYGGNLSVRKRNENRPCICVGEDESSYSQFTFSSKTWKGPNGEETLKPKGEGETLMVAAFCSREFGLGRQLSVEELYLINNFRDEKRNLYLARGSRIKWDRNTKTINQQLTIFEIL